MRMVVGGKKGESKIMRSLSCCLCLLFLLGCVSSNGMRAISIDEGVKKDYPIDYDTAYTAVLEVFQILHFKVSEFDKDNLTLYGKEGFSVKIGGTWGRLVRIRFDKQGPEKTAISVLVRSKLKGELSWNNLEQEIHNEIGNRVELLET